MCRVLQHIKALNLCFPALPFVAREVLWHRAHRLLINVVFRASDWNVAPRGFAWAGMLCILILGREHIAWFLQDFGFFVIDFVLTASIKVIMLGLVRRLVDVKPHLSVWISHKAFPRFASRCSTSLPLLPAHTAWGLATHSPFLFSWRLPWAF